MTETQVLYNTLQAAVSHDASIRVPAYEALQSLKQREGYAPSLLQVALTSGVEPSMRQLCAVEFKNEVDRRWSDDKQRIARLNTVPLTANDRQLIRPTFVASIVACDDGAVRRQLLVAFKAMVQFDFPTHWPDVVEQILAHFGASEPQQLLGALQCLRYVLKTFDYKQPENNGREPVNRITAHVFPMLLPLFEHAVQATKNDDHAAELRKVLLQVFVF